MSQPFIHLADCVHRQADRAVEGSYVTMAGDTYYRIGNVDRMPPFFMSIVSASDLWLFIASTGGLTAGRVSAESALFPYETDDRLTENSETTGPKMVLLVSRGERRFLWEPFSARDAGLYRTERNLYKRLHGNEILFEEINHDLGLGYRYSWRSSDAYGFVKTSWLINRAREACKVELLDGLQNLLPSGVTPVLQISMSNLLNAYKRSELEPRTGLGIFALSSTLTDLAEPSEALRATTVWQLGLERVRVLLSSQQLDDFRRGRSLTQEVDVRGRRGAYFVTSELSLAAGERRSWKLVAEVEQDHAGIAELLAELEGDRVDLDTRLEQDIRRGDEALAAIIARADGAQWTADQPATSYHATTVLFNVMRGGIFLDDGVVHRADLLDFVRTRNRDLLQAQRTFFDALPDSLAYRELIAKARETAVADLVRLCYEYLPLTFSRRHGDPSRPWNRFAIHVRKADGSPRLDYQGNWRDIFQNWEALAQSFPGFLEGMICKFLNATTADGYNPYRITRDGIEWEAPEPENPWANIGYWSDHQIIYLLKLLEAAERFHPGALEGLLVERIFSHANVPYRIKPYEALLENGYDTITFDLEAHRRIEASAREAGTDAKLIPGPDGATFHVTMSEKLLLLLLAKLANLVPEGGIWMNTQRPEWNDANNALVGKGLSVVTVGYLVRFVPFLRELFARCEHVELTREVADFLAAVDAVLEQHEDRLAGPLDGGERRAVMDALGRAGSAYRTRVYERLEGFSGETTRLDTPALERFLARVQAVLEHTLRANRRDDDLFHSYNILLLGERDVAIDHLEEMLEGQVAALSSGLLSGRDAVALLTSLRESRLYRSDQHSYLLYPDRSLPGFLEKNQIPPDEVRDSALVAALLERGDPSLVVRDRNGELHFNGDLRNAASVRRALAALAERAEFAAQVAAEGEDLVALFERVFDHGSFTGRSGSFFAYEGLGSIYWHMVSKLRLAVQEAWQRAAAAGEAPEVLDALLVAYYDVRAGLGFNKEPEVYGAFPTDPYSHTPAHKGAQQPGMTGQVKEDVLARFGELGVVVEEGRLGFEPSLLRPAELLSEPRSVTVQSLQGPLQLALEAGSLAFTFCQVPIVYHLDDSSFRIEVSRVGGTVTSLEGNTLDAATSRDIFERTGAVVRIDVSVPGSALVAGPEVGGRSEDQRDATGTQIPAPVSAKSA